MRKQTLAALLAAMTLPSWAGAQGLIMVPDVSYDMALVMATTAIEQCRSRGFAVGVSVVDRGGHVLVTLRDHAAAHHTVELAQRKAYTSRVFRQTTRAFSQRLIDNPISAGLGTTSGVVGPTITVTADGFTATVSHTTTTKTCAVYVGSTPLAPANKEGEPKCA